MEKRAARLLFISVFLLLSMSSFAFAAILTPVDNVMLQINPNSDLGLDNVRNAPTIWIISVFTIIFAVLYAGSSFVPMFNEQRGPRIAFSIAIAILTVFVPGPIAVMAGLGVIVLIVFLILALFFIFFTIGRDFMTGYTEAGTRGHRAATDSASARREREEAERQLRRDRAEEEARERAARRGRGTPRTPGTGGGASGGGGGGSGSGGTGGGTGGGSGGGSGGGGTGGGGGSGGRGRPPGRVPPRGGLAPPKRDDPPTTVFKPGIPGSKTKGHGPKPKPHNPKIPDEQEVFEDLSPMFNGIRSQNGVGACTAFAAASVFEYILNALNHKTKGKHLSPLFLYYYSRLKDGTSPASDRGIHNAENVMKSMTTEGVSLEEKWPFIPPAYSQQPSPDAENDARLKKITTYRTLDAGNADDWAYEIVHNKNPIYIAVDFPNEWHKPYNQKFYPEFGKVSAHGGHAMVIVGYHSHYPHNGAGVKAFKIRNSHGADWGEDGYTWIPAETLKFIMWGGANSPYIIEGWMPEQQKEECKIKGRVIFDPPNDKSAKIDINKTGKQLFSDNKIESPCDDHAVKVGVWAQVNNKLIILNEMPVKGNKGRFEIKFDVDPTRLERLTALHNYKEFSGIDFTKMPAGVIVCKTDADEKEFYFHIVKLISSCAGRGGEGMRYKDNPCSHVVTSSLSFSGIPIAFTKNHRIEENVIVPVYWAGGVKGDQDNLTQKARKALAAAENTYNEETVLIEEQKKLIASIYDSLKENKLDEVRANLRVLAKIFIKTRRRDKELVKELKMIEKDLPSKFKWEFDRISNGLQRILTQIEKYDLVYYRDMRRRIIKLMRLMKNDAANKDKIRKEFEFFTKEVDAFSTLNQQRGYYINTSLKKLINDLKSMVNPLKP